MDLIWVLLVFLSSFITFILVKQSGSKLTAKDYREDLIHKYFDQKFGNKDN